MFTPWGQYVTQYNSGVNQPAGIMIDEEGNIFVVDNGYNRYNSYGYGVQNRARGRMTQANQVCILDSKYNIIHSFGTNGAGTGITIDKEGSIYICSRDNYQIEKY